VNNRFLTKLAKTTPASKTPSYENEKPHVQDSLRKLEDHNGVITEWSTGSGKSKNFLLAVEREHVRSPDARALILAPASLVTNVDKEIRKHGLKVDRKRLDVYSYEKATRIADELKKNKYAIAVADEAQKLRNANTQRTRELSEVLSNADKRLLATATANFNHSADIAPLVNIAHGSKILPENPKEFEQIFIGKEKLPRSIKDIILRKPAQEVDALKNKGVLKELFKRHVSYYDSAEDPEAAKHFPKVTETTHEVEMSPHQVRMYKFMENDLPFWIKMKIRYNLPMDKQEKAAMNSFSSGVRQVSNSTRQLVQDRDSEEATPKIQKAVGSLVSKMGKDKNFRGLVYSNYLDAGTDEYSRKLSEHKVPHVVFTGKLTKDQKDQAVKDYNSGKVKVLIVSSSGSEGLDLKGTKLTQVLEPHFNPSKIKQVKGRGARFKSHEHLPEEERNMEVEHYLSVFPKSSFGTPYTSIDKYLAGMSDDKQVIFNQIKDVMRDANGKKKPEAKQ